MSQHRDWVPGGPDPNNPGSRWFQIAQVAIPLSAAAIGIFASIRGMQKYRQKKAAEAALLEPYKNEFLAEDPEKDKRRRAL
jgi:hypothetical protein